jgi:hypothetical protein
MSELKDSESENAHNMGKAHGFYEVGSILRYEYEVPYAQGDIEDFFDKKADEIINKLEQEASK